MVSMCLILLETAKVFYRVAVPFLHAHQQCMRVAETPLIILGIASIFGFIGEY